MRFCFVWFCSYEQPFLIFIQNSKIHKHGRIEKIFGNEPVKSLLALEIFWIQFVLKHYKTYRKTRKKKLENISQCVQVLYKKEKMDVLLLWQQASHFYIDCHKWNKTSEFMFTHF